MKSGRGVLSLFDGLIDRLLCLFGAVAFSQGPEFMQQYLQRLGGHLAESKRQLAAFQLAAQQGGMSLDKFIVQTTANPDPGLSRLGTVMGEAAERTSHLQASHDALLHAPFWSRPFIFMRHLDVDIARATGAIYQPAVPTTLEGLVYALTGMFMMLAIYHLVVKNLIALCFRRRPRPPAPVAA